MQNKPTILVVDDTEIQLTLIEKHLSSLSHQCELEMVSGGKIAWERLSNNPEHYDLVLLDRNMPDLDGLEVLKLIRKHEILKKIPVILQTAQTEDEEILEGMQAGAYYYLTKPFTRALLTSIVETALRERLQQKALQEKLTDRDRSIKFVKKALIEFKTIEDAVLIAALVANTCPNPKDIVTGLAELLVNAVEHGNLGISYAEKTELRNNGKLEQEIARRLDDPEFKNRIVKLEITSSEKEIEFIITDEGNGFNWKPFLNFSPERMMDNHGRGIALANKLCFSRLKFQGKGNIVSAYVDNI